MLNLTPKTPGGLLLSGRFTKLLLFMFGVTACTMLMSTGHAAAACGVAELGNLDEYGGAVISSVVQDSAGNIVNTSTNTQVVVSTEIDATSPPFSSSTPPNGIRHIDASNHKNVISSRTSATFNQYDAGPSCSVPGVTVGGNVRVVLGYGDGYSAAGAGTYDGVTSSPTVAGVGASTDGSSVWLLDCFHSKHPDHFQSFKITASGTPAGYNSGDGTWNVVITNPSISSPGVGSGDYTEVRNGSNSFVNLFYTLKKNCKPGAPGCPAIVGGCGTPGNPPCPGGGCGTPGNPPCPVGAVETPPTFSLTATCDGGATLHSVYDANNVGGGVYYYGVIYQLDAAGAARVDGSEQAFSGRVYGGGDVNFPWPVPVTNYGWSAQFGVSNVRASDGGDDAWPSIPPDIQRVTAGGPGGCYQASCTLTVNGNVPGGGANDVQAGQPFTVTLVMTNTGPGTLPNSVGVQQLALTHSAGLTPISGSGNPYYLGPAADIPIPTPSGSITRTISYKAPNSVSSQSISAYPDYYGRFAIGPQCTGSATNGGIRVNQHFVLHPRSTSVATPPTGTENASGADYKTWAYADGGVTAPTTVPAPSLSRFYIIPAATGIPVDLVVPKIGGTFGVGPPAPPPFELNSTYPIPIASLKAGDRYCAIINLTVYSAGWIGPGGVVVNATNPNPTSGQTCLTINNKPYFQSHGTGVSAGGSVGGSCNAPGLLASWNKWSGAGSTPYGAGADLSAISLSAIVGFASAQNTAPPNPIRLTFANNTPPLVNTNDSPALGGKFSPAVPPANAHCIKPPAQPTNSVVTAIGASSIDISTLHGKHAYSYTGPQLTITAPVGYQLSPGDDISIFASNDVALKNPITYVPIGWAEGTVPSFVLVSKSGSIYIDKLFGHTS